MRTSSSGTVTFQLGILCAAVAIASSQGTQGVQDRWAQADASIVRHPPGRFTELPLRIRRDLESRGCRVPQSDVDGPVGSHNVISGQFTTGGGRQWAVLCSIRDTSRILVYPNDSTTAADSLAPEADRVSLQQVEMGRIAYSRRISAVTSEAIRARALRVDTKMDLPSIVHAGIEDAFLGKASVVYYNAAGRSWLRLIGPDEIFPAKHHHR
jgi:hypothetical protein